MQQRISIITLGVRDLAKVSDFYDSLGWNRASEDGEGIIAYNLPNISFALYPLDKLGEDAMIEMEKPKYSSFTLAYNVETEEDVDKILEKVKELGAEIIKSAEKVFWGGYSGYFTDPEGQLWEVAYNPFSPLGENGEFQWGGVK